MRFGFVTRVARVVVGAGIVALGVSTPVQADWAGKGEGGLLLSCGNSESTSANAKLDIAEEQEGRKHSVLPAGLYSRGASFVTGQRLGARAELDRKITVARYAYGALRGERDLFSGFAYQVSLRGGLGYKFIDSAETKLAGALGVGYRRRRPEQRIKDPSGEVTQRITGYASGSAVGTAAISFEHLLTKTTKRLDKPMVEPGSSDTSVSNDFQVQVSMTDRRALAFGYGMRYNTDPAPGTKRLDELTTVNIV